MEHILLYGSFPLDGVRLMREACGNAFKLSCIDQWDLAIMQEADYVVLRGPAIGREELKALGNVKLIHRWGVGYDTVDVKAAGEMGIPVAITTGANAQAVAEITVALMLAAYRHLPALIQRAKEGRADKEDITDDAYLLQGKKIGLLGFGNIGKKVCRLLSGFNPKLYYFDVIRSPEKEEQDYSIEFCSKEKLISECDIVSIHMPLLESTYHMINEFTLSTMKPNALLVNTSRGGIVDTQALLEALECGKLWGAALDTVENEPLPKGHALLQNSRVILLPHSGGSSYDINQEMVRCIMRNIYTVASGQELETKYLANKFFLHKST